MEEEAEHSPACFSNQVATSFPDAEDTTDWTSIIAALVLKSSFMAEVKRSLAPSDQCRSRLGKKRFSVCIDESIEVHRRFI